MRNPDSGHLEDITEHKVGHLVPPQSPRVRDELLSDSCVVGDSRN